MKVAVDNPQKAVRLHQSDIDNLKCLKWTNINHSSYWDFLFSFMASFYKIDVADIRKGKYPQVIRSIIWGNTNSIEKYDIQAKNNNVPLETYDKIKTASVIFDDPNHLVKIAKPKVLIVLNWNEGIDWFAKNITDVHYYQISEHMFYYYLRSTNTHIFQTHHPRSISIRFGFDNIIEELLSLFRSFHIWETLPSGIDDIFAGEVIIDNTIRRHQFIADLAGALIKTHSIMWGQSLVDILNRNGITKDNGDIYSTGRGIYRPISAAWNYFHNIIGDEQTAYNIAMSFVNKNGDPAY